MDALAAPVYAALDAAREPVDGLLPRRRRRLGRRRACSRCSTRFARARAAARPRGHPGRAGRGRWRRELAARPGVGLHQHGLAHANHEREGRKCEFGPSRDARRAARATSRPAASGCASCSATGVDPIFTPPWNRCTPDTGDALAELGFAALSREPRAEPLGVPGLRELPVQLDWVAHRRGSGSLSELGARFAGGDRRGAARSA